MSSGKKIDDMLKLARKDLRKGHCRLAAIALSHVHLERGIAIAQAADMAFSKKTDVTDKVMRAYDKALRIQDEIGKCYARNGAAGRRGL